MLMTFFSAKIHRCRPTYDSSRHTRALDVSQQQ